MPPAPICRSPDRAPRRRRLRWPACAVGPNYVRPSVETPPAFKEAQGWTPAQPADGLDRGDWWAMFNDPVLNGLEKRVDVSNQNLAAAEAAYRQARALVAEDRAQFFPTVDLTGSATEAKPAGGSTSPPAARPGPPSDRAVTNTYQVNLGASWAPDVWGAIRRTIEGAKAQAQASAADLANARLSAQSELAADYLELRLLDAQKAMLTTTVDAYARTLTDHHQPVQRRRRRQERPDHRPDHSSTTPRPSLVDLGVQRTARPSTPSPS